MQRKRLRVIGPLLGLAAGMLGLCALCPISNALFLRPFLANFDSRYISGFSSRYQSGGPEPVPFDRGLWKRGRAVDRLGMAKQFVRDDSLDGKTRAELVEMFGEPDFDKPGDEGLRWRVGFVAKGLFDETLWLTITVKEDGSANGAIVWKDWIDPRR